MSSGEAVSKGEVLADRYAALWKEGEVPDVFEFLGAHPSATIQERVDVVRIDQQRRWRAGMGRPVEHYLIGAPEIAEKTELIDLLISEERRVRDEVGDPTETETAETTIDGPDGRRSFSLHRHPTRRAETIRDDPAGPPPASTTETLANDPSPTETKSLHSRGTDDGMALPTPDPARPGAQDDALALTVSNRFEIRRTLGKGGMGVVYQAYDRERGETVALKTMRQADPRALYRFKQEFRTLSDLTHPNLVNLYELFAVGDLWFFTMELIEGTDFISYVRSAPIGPGPDALPADLARCRIERLRDAFRQLVAGVQALHDAGKLHRDIKPTNLLVTPSGRVVLLDFGVSIELNRAGPQARGENQIVGTVPYMAPEQGAARDVGAASDWYSVGVVLYEAMTGRLPFQGKVSEVLAAKRETDPPPPGTLVSGLPADLGALCMELLRRDPAARPSGREILSLLDGVASALQEAGSPRAGRPVPLIGRGPHLKVLGDAFRSVKEGRPETVFVFGRSGSGKSALMQSFLNDLIEHDEAVVLSGRCHERESLRYKALDSVVDALTRYLVQLGPGEVEPILPDDVPLLARVFPVLQRVEAVAAAPRPAVETPDQRELRRRAFAALRALLCRIGAGKTVVVAIDDLQWGDVEDAPLLVDLLRLPDPPPILFLASYRNEDAPTSPILQALLGALGQEELPVGRRELAVEALSHAESRELALAMVGQDHAVARAEAHLIARESHGNPLFIGELVKHAQGGGRFSERPPSAGEIDLEEVLWERVQRLSDDARRLLEAVAVSGRPIHQFEAGLAAGLAADARAVAVSVLRAARLIRTAGASHRDQVETYHDRIRDTVVTHLSPGAVTDLHRRLAQALEAGGHAEPEVLAAHFRGAGQLEKAGRYYARAADKAAEELAFLHAAGLYRQAVELRGAEDAETRRLRTGLGDALANAGRGGEAAEAYLRAAESAMVGEALELKRRAAMQWLISGNVDQGLAALRSVLAAMDMAMPDSPGRALASLRRARARLRLRGLGFRTRDVSQVSAEDLARVDVCWSAAAGLSLIDPIRGADFQTRGFLLALGAGEPSRVARAMAMEAAFVATAGGPGGRRLARLLSTAEQLADRLDQPYPRAMVRMAHAMAALMFGRWKEARDAFDQAASTFRERCTGVAWELDTVANLSLWAVTRLGDLAELRRRWSALLKETRARGEAYASTRLNTDHATILRLADGDAHGARCALQVAASTPAQRSFHLQHLAALRSRVHVLLYEEEWQAAWDQVQSYWPTYARSLLPRVQMLRIELLELRARCALAAAYAARDPESLWRSAERDAGQLERERMPWARAHACLIRAGLALARSRTPAAVALLADAARRYEAEEMRLEAAVARRLLGSVLGDDQGRSLSRESDAWLAEQGVRHPDRMSAMLAPGFHSGSRADTQEDPPRARHGVSGGGRECH